MEVFRIIYALHFALGCFLALRLWPFLFAIYGLVSDLSLTFRDFVAATAISCLVALWYFVWYGSIRFAVRGSFPLVSIRVFAALFAAVYLGAGCIAWFLREESGNQLATSQPGLIVVVSGMLSLAAATAVLLPRVRQNWDVERQRLIGVRNERLDEMHRTTNPRV